MGWIDQVVVRQGKQFFVHTSIQTIGIAILEIRTAASVDEQGIAGKDTFARHIRKMPIGVPRCM
jgi:hypothetical protein